MEMEGLYTEEKTFETNLAEGEEREEEEEELNANVRNGETNKQIFEKVCTKFAEWKQLSRRNEY